MNTNPMIIQTAPYIVADVMSPAANLYSGVMQFSDAFCYTEDTHEWKPFEWKFRKTNFMIFLGY